MSADPGAGAEVSADLLARLRQEVAGQFRLELNAKLRQGLIGHSAAGYNIGPAPYGYVLARIPHPDPVRASRGCSKGRLVLDPVRAPVVAQIFTWRAGGGLAVTTITARLNADPARYPPPSAPGWTPQGVTAILRNPKYTGYMVYGRTSKRGDGRKRGVPPEEWTWSPEITHPPVIGRATWEATQRVAASRGNVRDSETPGGSRGRSYILRSRIRCRACRRRMAGSWTRGSRSADSIYVYYKCPYDPGNPRHIAASPGHGSVSLREDVVMEVVTGLLGQCVRASAGTFTPDLRAAVAALGDAPDRVMEALLAAFDVQVLYDKDAAQITAWAVLPAA